MVNELGIKRTPTQQDLSWFLDLYQWEQLDLNPSYQRNSIWGRSDKTFFLNTVFNNYPCPAIYIQKEINKGKTSYFVVDGKQRLQTVFDFFKNKISIPSDFGDVRLNGKKWKDISNIPELANIFYDYKFTVEILTGLQNDQWNEVFDRLNRNAKVLTEQELRHARYNGWLITKIEEEADEENLNKEKRFWQKIGIASKSRVTRMKDIEFISILMLVILKKDFIGFPQSDINELYAIYDKITSVEDEPEFEDYSFTEDDAAEALKRFQEIKSFINKIQESTSLITSQFFRKKLTTHLYSLWCYFAINEINELSENLVLTFQQFFDKLQIISNTEVTEYSRLVEEDPLYKNVIDYFENSSGAATEVTLRKKRHEALTEYVNSFNVG